MDQGICVFCASSNAVASRYFDVATQVGNLLAENGFNLVYGGGKVGLMGAVAMAVHQKGGKVLGIIPECLMAREVAYTQADELIVTDDMFQRKQLMIDKSKAFVVLPGGFGTLDEVMEVITLKQLGTHQKPIEFLNTDGFFDDLLTYFEKLKEAHCVPDNYPSYYRIHDEPESLVNALKSLN